MKKILTFFCGIVFAAQFSFVAAQTATMKVWKGGIVTAEYNDADVDSVTLEATNKQDLGGGEYLINGHKFVDLDLPSGLLWAETNIGAETITDHGDYFAWGETSPKDVYSWGTYTHGTSAEDLTKYNSNDGKTVLDKKDDAAYVNWGSPCRMPTSEEINELINNCDWEWKNTTNSTSETRLVVWEVTSKTNGNSILFPLPVNEDGEFMAGDFWSSTLFLENISSAYGSHLTMVNANVPLYRCEGSAIRPVTER